MKIGKEFLLILIFYSTFLTKIKFIPNKLNKKIAKKAKKIFKIFSHKLLETAATLTFQNTMQNLINK